MSNLNGANKQDGNGGSKVLIWRWDASETGSVAIFSYQEHFGECKGYYGDKAHIRSFGPWTPVHPRHIRQQSEYTVAPRQEENRPVFCSHQEAILERPFEFLRFDEFVKFQLPVSVRDEALIDLRRMNIKDYSLFGSTDALVKTVSRFAMTFPWDISRPIAR